MRIFLLFLVLYSFTALSQIPQGYYDSASGLSGQPLRAALQDIIDNHNEQSYASIWTHFQTTDDDENGKVWDMYSDIPGGNPYYTYSFVTDQCGNYAAEGDCYNREHSFPKSWFNDAAPMITDLFHIYPTDGYVNGKRSNYPFGQVSNPDWTSTNGSKVGNCSFTGYSGVVFEPINEYKGDFARTYFYMMTRYMDQVDSWTSDMLSGNDLSDWAKAMLLEWDINDPVSQKETDRNNAVYLIQNNRNPFIDHPEFAGLIWDFPSYTEELSYNDIRIWYTGGIIYFNSKSCLSGRLSIYNIMGQQLHVQQINNSSKLILFDLIRGIYLVVFESDKGILSFKLVVA